MSKIILSSELLLGHIEIHLEFKPPDFWIGAFWQKTNKWQKDIWVCILPCFPIHFVWWRSKPKLS